MYIQGERHEKNAGEYNTNAGYEGPIMRIYDVETRGKACHTRVYEAEMRGCISYESPFRVLSAT